MYLFIITGKTQHYDCEAKCKFILSVIGGIKKIKAKREKQKRINLELLKSFEDFPGCVTDERRPK